MAPTRNGSVRPIPSGAGDSTPLSSRHLFSKANGFAGNRRLGADTPTTTHDSQTATRDNSEQRVQQQQQHPEDDHESGRTRGNGPAAGSVTHLESAGSTAESDAGPSQRGHLPTGSQPSNQSEYSRWREPPNHHFDPRQYGSLTRKRQAHDVMTSVCMFVLMPTAFVILLVYLVMLCKYYSCVRNAVKLAAALLGGLVWSGPIRMFSDLAGIPVALGLVVSLYYLVIFYFNSDVPGVRPPLPQVSWKAGVRADPNYSFGLLLGLVCLIMYSLPEILLFHSSRIYSTD